jgi:hypothetical protein
MLSYGMSVVDLEKQFKEILTKWLPFLMEII